MPDVPDWGDVHELVRKSKIRELRTLFREGMTFKEFCANYEYRAEDRDYLHLAARQGDLELVKLLVEQGADTGELDNEFHITALETAVQHKQHAIAEYLVSRTESQDARKAAWLFLSGRRRATSLRRIDRQLFEAVCTGDGDRVRTALREGADPNCIVPDKRMRLGASPLSKACLRADLPVVQALIEGGADVNLAHKSYGGATPLHFAGESALGGAPEIVRLLLKAGAAPNHQRDNGETPLHEACRVERSGWIEDRCGREQALGYLQGHVRIVEHLLEHGASPHIRAKEEGKQPIHMIELSFSPAAGKNQQQIDCAVQISKHLVRAGGDVHTETDNGYTTLMLVRGGVYEDYKSALIEAGVLDPRSDELVQAAVRNDERAVRKLLKAGANVNHHGDAPSFAAEMESLPQMVGNKVVSWQFIPGEFARQVTPLHVAVAHQRLDLARLLLEAGANPDARGLWLVRDADDPRIWEPKPREDWYGFEHAERFMHFTPLMAAAEHRNLELLRLLIEAGADLDLNAPLFHAIQRKATEVVKVLIDAGADPRLSIDRPLGQPRNALSLVEHPAVPAEIRRLVRAAAAGAS